MKVSKVKTEALLSLFSLRYRQLLEMRSPGVSITRKIQNLRNLRNYLNDQLLLARKALGAELQAEAVMAGRGSTRT